MDFPVANIPMSSVDNPQPSKDVGHVQCLYCFCYVHKQNKTKKENVDDHLLCFSAYQCVHEKFSIQFADTKND